MKGIVIFLAAILVVNCEETEEDTKKYLSEYGYYNENQYGGDNVVEALKLYQRKFDLLETGVVDEATKKLMHTGRCGMKDIGAEVGNANAKWDKEHLTYSFKSYTRDLGRRKINELTAEALNIWGRVTPLQFSKTSSGGDIVIEFVTGRHGVCPYPFNGPGGVLAHAYYPWTNVKGQVHFDDDEKFTTKKPRGINYLWVATHEFGHTLGLEHDTNNKYAVMYPYIRPYSYHKGDVKLHPNDKYRIQSLYGSRGTGKKTPRRRKIAPRRRKKNRRPVTRAPKIPGKKPPTVAPSLVCRDKVDYCSRPYLLARCTNDIDGWMLKNCPNTCGFCTPQGEKGCFKACQDYDSRCKQEYYTKKCRNYNRSWTKWQKQHCALTCNHCCKA